MTRQIDTDAVIDSIRIKEQASAPATPAAGYRNLYAKATGLWLIDDAGNEYQISPDVIGTAYQILRVNSGTTGVEYASVGRVLISEQTPTGTGTVTWSSIPATYKSLELEFVARSTNAATNVSFAIYFNNDTTATNYRRTIVYGQAVNTVAALGAADSAVGWIAGASSDAGSCGQGYIKITQYAGTTFKKQAWAEVAMRAEDTTIYERIVSNAIEWESTAAINRVDLVLSAGNYDTGSTLRLYGVY